MASGQAKPVDDWKDIPADDWKDVTAPPPTSAPDSRNNLQRAFDTVTTVTPEQEQGHSPLVNRLQEFGAGAIQGAGMPFVHPLQTAEGIGRTAGNVANALTDPNYNGASLVKTGTNLAHTLMEHPAQTAGNLVGGAILGGLANEAGGAASDLIPTRAKAGKVFESVMGDAQNQPVNLNQSSEPLLRVRELADRGTSMPQVANKLLKRVTDPEQGPLTYREARDFASNLSRMSSGEVQKLNPVMQRQLGVLSHAFNEDVGNAAEGVGRGADYADAMKQYRQASRLRSAATTAAKVGTGAAIGGTILNKFVPALLPSH